MREAAGLFSVNIDKINGRMGEKGLNKKTLARKLGVSSTTITKYLKEPDKIPYLKLKLLAEVLEFTIGEARAYFFDEKLAQMQDNAEEKED